MLNPLAGAEIADNGIRKISNIIKNKRKLDNLIEIMGSIKESPWLKQKGFDIIAPRRAFNAC